MSRRPIVAPTARVLLAALFGVAGVMHLLTPAFFAPQFPSFLPAPELVIRLVGVPFLLGAGGLLGPRRFRRPAALGLVVLLLVVWPGNWWGAVQPGSYVDPGGPDVLDWVRVPFQLVLVALVVAANLDVLRAPLRIEATTEVAADVVLAALTDFGPARLRRFATLDPATFAVHATSATSAEVTEGARPPGPVERERYDWSEPGRVRIRTLGSTVFRPGSWWLYEIEGDGPATRVRLTVDRRPATGKGWVITVVGWFVGRRILGADLRRTLAALRGERVGA